MIPVNCQCANNINGMCHGNVNDATIHDVNSGKFTWEDQEDGSQEATIPVCPGKIPIGSDPFEGVAQGDRKISPGGTTIIE